MDEEMGNGRPKSFDMMIPGQKVDLIIGKGGETIKQLQEKSGVKMVVIKNNSNQKQEHLLRITGDPFEIKFAKQLVNDLIAEKKIASGDNEAFVDIMIPANKVRLIVDKGGETIKQLRKRFGVKMVFIENVPNQKQKRSLRITGDPSKIEFAKQLVFDLIAGKKIASGGSEGFVDIMIPAQKVDLVIGKGGETIKQLRERSGTEMTFIKNNPNQQQESPLRITGDPSKIELAKQLVHDLIAEKKIASGGSEAFVDIMIPAPKVGLVIGKGGETIKQLRERSGTKMTFLKNNPNQQQKSPLRITGDLSQIELAKQLVYDLIAEKKIFVPRKTVGMIIGKNGEMIKKIQGQTGARVRFQETGMEGLRGGAKCHLSGTPDQIKLAIERIEQIINTFEKEQLRCVKSSRRPKNKEREDRYENFGKKTSRQQNARFGEESDYGGISFFNKKLIIINNK